MFGLNFSQLISAVLSVFGVLAVNLGILDAGAGVPAKLNFGSRNGKPLIFVGAIVEEGNTAVIAAVEQAAVAAAATSNSPAVVAPSSTSTPPVVKLAA